MTCHTLYPEIYCDTVCGHDKLFGDHAGQHLHESKSKLEIKRYERNWNIGKMKFIKVQLRALDMFLIKRMDICTHHFSPILFVWVQTDSIVTELDV